MYRHTLPWDHHRRGSAQTYHFRDTNSIHLRHVTSGAKASMCLRFTSVEHGAMRETGHAVPPSHLTILQADSHLFHSLAELVAYVVAST